MTAPAWIAVVIVAMTLSSCSTIFETPEIRSNELSQAAAQAVRDYRFSDAEKLFADAAAEAEKSNNLLQVGNRLDDLAGVYMQDGKKELAIATLRRAIDVYRRADQEKLRSYDSLLIHQLLTKDLAASANLESDLGHYTDAEQLFKQALSTNEKDTEDWNSRIQIMKDYASVLRKLHKDDDAYNIEITLAGNDLDASEWDRIYREGTSFYRGECFEPAKQKAIDHDLDILRQSIKQFKGRSARTHYVLGLRELASGNSAGAESELRQCIDIYQKVDWGAGGPRESPYKPKFLSDAFTVLAFSLERQGKNREADLTFRKALSSDRETAIGRLMTMTNIYRKRDLKVLDELMPRVFELIQAQPEPIPSDVNALIELAVVHNSLGQKDQAQVCFSEAIKLESRIKKQPSSEKVYFCTLLADQLVNCGRESEAEIYYQKGIAVCRKEQLYKSWPCSACLRHYALRLDRSNRHAEAAKYQAESSKYVDNPKEEKRTNL